MLGHVSTSAVGKRAQQAGVRFREGGVLDSMKGGGGGGGGVLTGVGVSEGLKTGVPLCRQNRTYVEVRINQM